MTDTVTITVPRRWVEDVVEHDRLVDAIETDTAQADDRAVVAACRDAVTRPGPPTGGWITWAPGTDNEPGAWVVWGSSMLHLGSDWEMWDGAGWIPATAPATVHAGQIYLVRPAPKPATVRVPWWQAVGEGWTIVLRYPDCDNDHLLAPPHTLTGGASGRPDIAGQDSCHTFTPGADGLVAVLTEDAP